MGVPVKMDGLFHGKSHLEMDDDWGYPMTLETPIGPPETTGFPSLSHSWKLQAADDLDIFQSYSRPWPDGQKWL